MKTIVLEMERLRNPNSGLGQYCLQLGRALAAQPASQEVRFECYLPVYLTGILGPVFGYRATRKWHKLTGVETDAALWHCTHQDAEYFPTGEKTAIAMTIHDLNFLERADFSGWRKKLKVKRLQQKINRCKGLIYISEFVKNAVHANLKIPEGISEQVIYNGVKVGVPAKQKQPADKKPYLFSIGLHPKKNYAALMPILVSNPDYQWIIAGADTKGYQADLLKEAKRFGVADRLTFKGIVREEEKWALYEQCSALLFPSFSEGFGLPVLEAMAFGKPVFLSNLTSLPEIGGDEAFYFKNFEPDHIQKVFEEGMEAFKNDPGKPQRLKHRASEFNWDNAANEYIRFYHSMI